LRSFQFRQQIVCVCGIEFHAKPAKKNWREVSEAWIKLGHLHLPKNTVTLANTAVNAPRKTNHFEELKPFIPAFAGMTGG
jgi:hypothetical protein